MANPRKFSEKIALHNQKQAEETAAFERIMQEVSVTRVIVSELLKTIVNKFFKHILRFASVLLLIQQAFDGLTCWPNPYFKHLYQL